MFESKEEVIAFIIALGIAIILVIGALVSQVITDHKYNKHKQKALQDLIKKTKIKDYKAN